MVKSLKQKEQKTYVYLLGVSRFVYFETGTFWWLINNTRFKNQKKNYPKISFQTIVSDPTEVVLIFKDYNPYQNDEIPLTLILISIITVS